MTTTSDWSTAPAWLLPHGNLMEAGAIAAWAKLTARDQGIEFDPAVCQPLHTAKTWAERINLDALANVLAPHFSGAERAYGEHRAAAADVIDHLKEIR